jgi:predicted nucleotide-binding protein (sugar kinase/HSP70/actin superfamily)
LSRFGLDARAMGEETAADCNIGKSLCRGSECLPLAVTTGKFMSVMEESRHDGLQVLLMPRAEGPCRFGQYATLQSRIFERAGLDDTLIFSPTSEDGYAFLSPSMELEFARAACLGDALFKLRCRIIPYHPRPAEAELLFHQALDEICRMIRTGKAWKDVAKDLMASLDTATCLKKPPRPLVGIVGEIYVRLNSFSNQHIVEAIEENGGEAWLAPMVEWAFYVRELLARKKTKLTKKIGMHLKNHILHGLERDVMATFSPALDQRHEPPIGSVLERGQRFLPISFEGESILTLGRARIFADQGVSLVANCSPFGCMPGRITSFIFQAYRDAFKAPVVNLFFDGTGDISSQVGIYLKSIAEDGLKSSQGLHRPSLRT